METIPKLRLLHILVRDIEFIYTWHEYLSKREFTRHLRESNPLMFVASIWILYRLGQDRVLQLEIKDRKEPVPGWEVYNMNKPFFSFTCINGDEFIKTFERNLYKELAKYPLMLADVQEQKQ